MAEKVWTVFVPYQYLTSPSGYIHCRYRYDFNIIYITNISSSSVSHFTTPKQFVGLWINEHSNDIVPVCKTKNVELFIALRSKKNNGVLTCEIEYYSNRVPVNCIIFDPTEMLQSYFFKCRHQTLVEAQKLQESTKIMDVLLTEVAKGRYFISKSEDYLQNVLGTFLKFLFSFQIFGHILDNRWTKKGILPTVIETPAISNHLVSRKREHSMLVKSWFQDTSNELQLLNIISRQLFDTFLGIILMYVVLQNGWTNDIASYILAWAHNVADELNSLLNWLMGAPAGLKLNRQLTEFLGHFFLYHIYLWKGYLAILEPILGTLLWYILLIGVLGLTAQLCLLQDVISIMTLHIYCFYVYAARLYRFQVYMLAALWRLFRGKKWNVLRRRVDSTFYDVDQLFVGTLLFTMLFFMLPTTTLYYVVFTLLRILVLMVQGVLYKAVQIFDSIPIFSIILWIFNSKKVAADILFNVLPNQDRDTPIQTMNFSMQITRTSFSKLIHKSQYSSTEQKPSNYSWTNIFGDVVSGHLIYPWVDKGKPST